MLPVLVGGFVVGCGAPVPVATAPPPSTTTAAVAAPVDSGVLGVQVPPGAVPGSIEGAFTLPGHSYESAVAWFRDSLPIGGAYQHLAFCEEGAGMGTVWHWYQGREWLTVMVLRDTDPVQVLVIHALDDPSVC